MMVGQPPCDCVHSGTWIIESTEGHDEVIGSGSADDESGDINISPLLKLLSVSIFLFSYFLLYFVEQFHKA